MSTTMLTKNLPIVTFVSSDLCDCGNNYGFTCCGARNYVSTFPTFRYDILVRIEKLNGGAWRIEGSWIDGMHHAKSDTLSITVEHHEIEQYEGDDPWVLIVGQAIWIRRMLMNDYDGPYSSTRYDF